MLGIIRSLCKKTVQQTSDEIGKEIRTDDDLKNRVTTVYVLLEKKPLFKLVGEARGRLIVEKILTRNIKTSKVGDLFTRVNSKVTTNQNLRPEIKKSNPHAFRANFYSVVEEIQKEFPWYSEATIRTMAGRCIELHGQDNGPLGKNAPTYSQLRRATRLYKDKLERTHKDLEREIDAQLNLGKPKIRELVAGHNKPVTLSEQESRYKVLLAVSELIKTLKTLSPEQAEKIGSNWETVEHRGTPTPQLHELFDFLNQTVDNGGEFINILNTTLLAILESQETSATGNNPEYSEKTAILDFIKIQVGIECIRKGANFRQFDVLFKAATKKVEPAPDTSHLPEAPSAEDYDRRMDRNMKANKAQLGRLIQQKICLEAVLPQHFRSFISWEVLRVNLERGLVVLEPALVDRLIREHEVKAATIRNQPAANAKPPIFQSVHVDQNDIVSLNKRFLGFIDKYFYKSQTSTVLTILFGGNNAEELRRKLVNGQLQFSESHQRVIRACITTHIRTYADLEALFASSPQHLQALTPNEKSLLKTLMDFRNEVNRPFVE